VKLPTGDQVISPGARFERLLTNLALAKEIWQVRYGDGFSNVPRPGVLGNGLVFICTGFQEPSLLAVRGGTVTEM